MKKANLVSFVVILGTSVALQAEFKVNTYTNDNQEHPAIAMDAAGSFVVVWESAGQDGSGNGVYGRRFDADGVPLGTEFQVNTTLSGYQDDPDIAMDGEGNFVVVWEGPDGDGEGVYARLYSADGQPRTDEFRVNSFTADRQKEPRVAMNESGAFVIVWEWPEPLPDYRANWHIVGQLYDPTGVPEGGNFIITQLPHGSIPDVAMDESGDFVVAWQRDGNSDNPPVGRFVMCRMYNADGTPKGNAIQITGGNYTYFSSIAMNSCGNFVITWSYHPDSSQRDVYAQRFDPDGNPISAPFMVNTYTAGFQTQSSAAMHDSGELVVVWLSEGQDGSSYGVFGQRYNSDDTPVSEEFQLNTYTLDNQWYPDIALSESGRFVVVWQSQGQDGSGSGIFADFGQLPRQLTYYVDRDAAGANNGSSWADAFNDLQDALAVVLTGDEIHVAEGIYKPIAYIPPPPPPPPPLPPLGSSNIEENVEPAFDRTATFQLKSGVVIKGGYAGFGQTDPNARDIKLYETILSGDLLGNDGPNFANNGENSYHVVTGSDCNESAVLDGFTITAGNADDYPTFSVGGGMHNTQSSPTVINCTFTKNTAHYAGAMSNQDGSNPILTDCTFIDNYAPGGGGGAIYYWHSGGSLINCSFRDNSGRHGGAARIYASDVTINNCLFTDNYSSGGEGGGAIYLEHCTAFFNLCTLSGNATDGSGGGIFNRDDGSNFTLQNCVLWNNSDSGGMDESAQVHSGTTMATIDYCCIQGWTGNFGGTGNIDNDPCFVNVEYVAPISYWKFDEGNGTTAYDSFGQNHGTVYGAQWATGQVDGALSFDGVDDYVGIPWDESLANVADNFTILLWAQPLSTHQIDPESSSGTSGTSGQKYAISARQGDYFWGSGHAGAGISIGTNGVSVYEHAADYMPAVLVWSGSVSGFTHVAVVYSHKQPRLYIDGESKKTGLQSSKIVHILSNIGGHRYGYFNGLIDDVHIYDRALSAEEIRQHYLSGLNGQGYPDANTPDYHLLPGSPCINTGDPDYISQLGEMDLDGKPRIIGGRIDMGAYEFNHNPIADAGPDQTIEAQAPWGAVVTLDGSDSSDADCTPGTFDDMNAFNWYELDPCDPNADIFLGSGVVIDCNLAIGEHIVLLEVIDRAGASDTNEVNIIVQDTTPPEFTSIPQDLIVECDGSGNVAELDAWLASAAAVDECGSVTITNDFVGLLNGCGATGSATVTWTAEDEYGNKATTPPVTFTIADTTPPDINCPADVTLEYPADTSPSATGKATATDTCGDVTVRCRNRIIPGCGNTETIERTWIAADECGNESSCMQTINVVDTTPPGFEFSVSPTMLWPPNHKMVEITPSWTVSDECDPDPNVSLVSVVANEGDDIIGDGHTTDDIQIDDDGSIFVRSERSGTNTGRVYTITYQAVDDCGNVTVRSATVSIPHDFKVLARIASRWLWSGPAGRIPEDLNGDGIVNLKDIAIFANNWIQ